MGDNLYKMAVFDLDETLLDADHRISASTSAYLKSLYKKGFILAICTGRSSGAIKHVIGQLNLDIRAHPLGAFPAVTANGAKGVLIYSTSQSCESEIETTRPQTKELFHQAVDKDISKKVIEFVNKHGFLANYYTGDDVYTSPLANNPAHLNAIKRYCDLTGVALKMCNRTFDDAFLQGVASKHLIHCESSEQDQILKLCQNEIGEHLNIFKGSPPYFIEILPKRVNKGTGLKSLCTSLGIELSSVVAYGDGYNDLELLKESGLGVAIKNATDELKAVADEVTDKSNLEDGVKHHLMGLEKSGLLKFSIN